MQKTIYLKDYQPPAFSVLKVALAFDLYEDHALVSNQMVLKRLSPGPLLLFGDELELLALTLDENLLDQSAYTLENGNLILNNCPDEFTLTILTKIRPQDNTKLAGLFRSKQIFCTQCEAEGFRRMTFFLDRPDVLTTFTTKISADKEKYPVLLSNGNLIDSGELPQNRHWVSWEDPFKKPGYLFALVAGNLASVEDHYVTASGKSVQLKIFVEPGNEDKCAHAMASVKQAMRWDEEKFGREYDLNIFMIVAVSDFNMGAMENKGLNIFNAKYILASPETATDQDFIDVEGVVGHEYFHNWTGNRVTCRDWFQLSLKEGLTVFRDQEFSRDMNSRDVLRIMDVKILMNSQFPEDASPLAHPVQPRSYQEINNFYTATVYNKGAEVIRMQQTLLGEAGFRRGMDLYFERHDGQAVTIDDFVAAMEDANGANLQQFKRWYSQAGTPTVKVDSAFKDGCLTLNFKQSCPPTPECQEKKPFHIPLRIALFDKAGQALPLPSDLIELKEEEETFRFEGLSEKPIVSLLRGFSAPIKLERPFNKEELLAILRFESDGYAKWDAAQRLNLDCIQGFLNKEPKTWQIPASFLEAYSQILTDPHLDPGLKAELLVPPSFEEVVLDLKDIDVDKVEEARDFFQQHLGLALYDSLKKTYLSLWKGASHAMHAKAYAERKLQNVCLWLMMKADEKRSLSLCQAQFKQAKTMSDELAAFSFLSNALEPGVAEHAAEQFYQRWSGNDLVLDKWFSTIAASKLPNTLERVKQLLTHPAFQFKNPNKLRALVGTFCQANPRNFHAMDGSGYQFLTEILKQLDPLNPQVAARLITPLTRWQRFNKTGQDLMKAQLKALSELTLSPDLREVVSKSLK